MPDQNILKQLLSVRLQDILPTPTFYMIASPILILLIGALVILLAGVFRSRPDEPNATAYGVGILSLVAGLLSTTAVALLHRAQLPAHFLGSGFLADDLSLFGFFVIQVGALATFALAQCTDGGRGLLKPELSALFLFATAGLMVLVASGEFIGFFIGLEIVSISLYVLVGYQEKTQLSIEGALKYFMLGATASGVILLGVALIYGATASLRFQDWAIISGQPSLHTFHQLGGVLFLSGLGFKLALAPFHGWAPDVYQASQSNLTGFMASLVKFALVIFMVRTLPLLGGPNSTPLVFTLWIMGGASITIGSVMGLAHRSVKRILAYSSVANAGFFCLGFAALLNNPMNLMAKQALIGYATLYALMSMGTFAILARWEQGDSSGDLLKNQLSGIGKEDPFFSVCVTLLLLGLAGIPPLAGFFGKFFLINAAVSEGLVGLSILLAVMSCVSLYYYLSIIVHIWLKEGTPHTVAVLKWDELKGIRWVVGFITALSLLVGIVGPQWIFELDYQSATEHKRWAEGP